MKSTPRERGDATITMLSIPTIQKIVEIMLQKFPLGSEIANEILEASSAKEPISDRVIDSIIIAIEEERDLSKVTYTEISDNEPGLVPYYVKKLKAKIAEDIRQKAHDV